MGPGKPVRWFWFVELAAVGWVSVQPPHSTPYPPYPVPPLLRVKKVRHPFLARAPLSLAGGWVPLVPMMVVVGGGPGSRTLTPPRFIQERPFGPADRWSVVMRQQMLYGVFC